MEPVVIKRRKKIPSRFCNDENENNPKLTRDRRLRPKGQQRPTYCFNKKPANCRYTRYRSEEARNESFAKWPFSDIKTTRELAEVGLFYGGAEDKAYCFSCGGGHLNWEKDDDPWLEHATFYPNCPFLLKQKGKSYVDAVQKLLKEKYAKEESRLATFKNWPQNANKTAEELAQAGFFYTGNRDEVKCFECGVSKIKWRVMDCVWFKHAKLNASCKFVLDVKGPKFMKETKKIGKPNTMKYDKWNESFKNQPIHKEYIAKDKRLESFKNWPSSCVKKPEELAKIGFYYTGKELVECFSCGGQHYFSLESENPAEEHASFYSECAFIRQVMGENFVELVREKFRKMYATEESRQKSFRNWPETSYKTPEEMIKAGFFCTGNLDQVQCFECGVSYMYWKIYDDPWFIHAKLNPSCEFVRRIKREIFVKRVLLTQKKKLAKKRSRTGNSDESCLSSDDTDDIKELMNSSTITAVLNLGFDKSKIEKMLSNGLKNHKSFDNAQELLAAALESQKQNSDLPDFLQYLEKENKRLKKTKYCEDGDVQGPIMIFVPCGHLHSCCSCYDTNLEQCVSCKEKPQLKLEMFPH